MKTAQCVIVALALAAAPPLHATTFTWSGGALLGSQWSRDNNWTTNSPPSNGTAALIFTGADRLDPNADSDWSILSITFNSSAGAFGIVGNTLTIGSGGVSNNDNNAQTINNNIILSAAQSWDTTSTGGLNFLGAVNTNTRLLTLSSAVTTSAIEINGAISGSGGMTINAAGHVNFTGPANSYAGTTTVNSGSLFLDKSAGVNSIVGPLVIGDGAGGVQGIVIVSSPNQIANTGDVTVNLGGQLEMNESDTIDNLTINNGSVFMSAAKSLVVNALSLTGGAISGNAGTLILNGNVTSKSSADGATIGTGVDLGGLARTFIVAAGAVATPDLTISGVISNGGIIKTGAGTLRMSGVSNTYTGSTTVNAGTLELSKNSGQTAISGPLIIGDGSGAGTVRLLIGEQIANTSSVTINGGVLDLNGFNETINGLTMTGGAVNTGAGTLTLGGNVTASTASAVAAAINGKLNLGAATRTFTVSDNAAAPVDLEINAVISNGSLIKDGAGTLYLSSATGSTFAGGLSVLAGEVVIGPGTSAGSGPLTMNAGTSIRADSAARNLGNPFNITGNITVGGSNELKFTGAIQLQSNLNLTVANTGLTNFAGSIGQDATPRSLTKTGAGTLLLGGVVANTYTGITTVNNGELQLGKTAGVNAIAGPLVIGDGLGNGLVRLLASDQIPDNTLVSMNQSSLLKLDGFSDSIGALTINAATIQDAVGTGFINLGGNVQVSVGGSQIFSGLKLGNATRTFDIADTAGIDPDLLILGPISNGGITKIGEGTLLLGASNTFAGGLTVNAGTIAFFDNSAAGTGTITFGAGATAKAVGNPRTLANPVNINGNMTIGGSANLSFTGPITLNGSRTLNITNTASTTLGPIGQGPSGGALTKTGPGTLTLTGNNTYTGETQIITGTLISAGSLASSPQILVSDGAKLEIANSQAMQTLIVLPGAKTTLTAAAPTVLTIDTLTLGAAGIIDLKTGALAINHPSNQSPFANIRGNIISGFAGGTWTGSGILSSTAAANSALAIGYAEAADIFGQSDGNFLGQTVDPSTVLVRTTLVGDANLDGNVGFEDLVKVAQHYDDNSGAATWNFGDFNYDGNVGFADLVKLAQNYDATFAAAPIPGASVQFGHDLAAAFASVPEPGGLTLLSALMTSSLLARRRR